MIKESCNLLGQELFGTWLAKQNFLIFLICTEKLVLRLFSPINKLISWKLKKTLNFGSFFAPFSEKSFSVALFCFYISILMHNLKKKWEKLVTGVCTDKREFIGTHLQGIHWWAHQVAKNYQPNQYNKEL